MVELAQTQVKHKDKFHPLEKKTKSWIGIELIEPLNKSSDKESYVG